MKSTILNGKQNGEDFIQKLPGNAGYALGYSVGFGLGMVTGTGKAIGRAAKKIIPSSVKKGYTKSKDPQPEVPEAGYGATEQPA